MADVETAWTAIWFSLAGMAALILMGAIYVVVMVPVVRRPKREKHQKDDF